MSLNKWLISTIIALVTLFLAVRKDFFVQPDVTCTLRELAGYPGADSGLSLAIKRGELPGFVKLQHGIEVHLRSSGNKPAVNVELRVNASNGSFIVQVHTDKSELIERLPDLGRQGSPDVFVRVRRMVPGEEVKLTFWYGIPDKPDITPKPPSVLARHSELKIRCGRSLW